MEHALRGSSGPWNLSAVAAVLTPSRKKRGKSRTGAAHHAVSDGDDSEDVLTIDVPPDRLGDSGIRLLAQFYHTAVQQELESVLAANAALLETTGVQLPLHEQERFVIGASKVLSASSAQRALRRGERQGAVEAHVAPDQALAATLVRRVIAALVRGDRSAYEAVLSAA